MPSAVRLAWYHPTLGTDDGAASNGLPPVEEPHVRILTCADPQLLKDVLMHDELVSSVGNMEKSPSITTIGSKGERGTNTYDSGVIKVLKATPYASAWRQKGRVAIY